MSEFRIDYHIHPNYSLDAEGEIFDYCLLAEKLGYQEIGFTPHCELDPERREKDDKVNLKGKIVSMRSDWLAHYFSEIEEARRKFPKLKIKAGIEIGYERRIEEEIRKIINTYPFDYTVGAIHCLHHIAIIAKEEIKMLKGKLKTPEEFLREYFSSLREMAFSSLFDILAHIDGYKKYCWEVYGDSLIREGKKRMVEFLKELAKSEVGIEINLSGFRHYPKEPYPGLEIIKKGKELGIKTFVLGSDCHRPSDFGFFLDRGREIISLLGINLTRFYRRQKEI
ncbi:MAG: histidinol-phosphatase [candidate division WOR-3 bacterium]